jgi:hypothetical protein
MQLAGPGAMPNGQLPELGARGAAPGTAYYIVAQDTADQRAVTTDSREPA